MKISVALCTFNGERFLAEQLESLATQTRHPDELVISDDGSSDKTVELLHAFANTAPFAVRIFESFWTPRGSSANFEFAIAQCDGDVIALCDQDDVWHAEKLHIIEKCFRSQETTLFFSNALLVDQHLNPTGRTAWDVVGLSARELALLKTGNGLRLLIRRNVVTGATMAVTRRVATVAIPFPEVVRDSRLPHQHDGWLAATGVALGRVVAFDKPLVLYRQHADQQIGLGAVRWIQDPWKKLSARLQNRAERIRAHGDWLSALAARLADSGVCLSAAHRDELNAAAVHFSVRARASVRRAAIRTLIPEVVRQRYARYSGGIGAAVLDALSIALLNKNAVRSRRAPSGNGEHR